MRLNETPNAKEAKMQVRIIGNDATNYRLVSLSGQTVGFAANYSLCLLIASRNGWRVVR